MDDQSNNTPKDFKTLTDVSDKLYQPVKRENKIRVVKIDASGVVVGGFNLLKKFLITFFISFIALLFINNFLRTGDV